MNWQYLFSPLQVGSVEISNRIFSTAHQTLFARAGVPEENMAAYHEARAAGGTGLIVMEGARPHASAVSDVPIINATTDQCIPGYRRVAELVHAHGTQLFGQLAHSGRVNYLLRAGMRGVTYSASALPDHRFHNMPRAMSGALIDDVISGFAAAARRLAEAGLDGIEIAASHGNLIAQFMNPACNRRQDNYGGSLQNRLRLLLETLAAVRGAIGRDLALGVRLSAAEFEPDGLDEEAMLEICSHLDGVKELDYLNVTLGSMSGPRGSVHVAPPMMVAPAYSAPYAASVRERFSRAVFVAGRINQPQLAENILAAGQADLCGMTRALIADPQMPNKARAGQLDDIRACIGCNQACIGHFHQGLTISCIQHPVSGRERQFGRESPAREERRVVVAGGGPAGLKAAAVAARRGHQVLLYEANAQLGGQALLARKLPGREEFGGLVSNLEREARTAGVRIQLNTAVTGASLLADNADAVILATGARPFWPDLELGQLDQVVDAWQVIEGTVRPGQRAVVADWRCDWVGLGVAEQLARSGCHVRLAVNGICAGQNLQIYLRDHWLGTLHRLGVEIISQVRLAGCDEDTVYFLHSASNEPVECCGVDTLVVAYGHASVCDLEPVVKAQGLELHLAGDCQSPRSAEEAVYEGMLAALAL
ncbi:MAG: FAD-dependent oxidoreductase [Arenicellales bacterium]|jgi:2,4-dienoyl-CoA reductase-like NADH-dependent reductase (Old Yellow Enzyme family)|nr:FAD-dependent oxidoreductase [Arenicellales bacterium]MEE1566289.1 FAD-dependent oxidoreductase [Arenicellales bacterium]HCV19906.1 oxidoreductase [Gammaproteobacteria bacterium]